MVLLAGKVSLSKFRSRAWQAEVAKLVERGLVAEWRPGGDWQTYMGRSYNISTSYHIKYTIISYKYTFGLYKFILYTWNGTMVMGRNVGTPYFIAALLHIS